MGGQKNNCAVADSKHTALVKTETGSLTARLFNDDSLEIESPNTISVEVERVGPNYKYPVPEGTVWRITTYISEPDVKKPTEGAIYINQKGEYILPGGENLNQRARKSRGREMFSVREEEDNL